MSEWLGLVNHWIAVILMVAGLYIVVARGNMCRARYILRVRAAAHSHSSHQQALQGELLASTRDPVTCHPAHREPLFT